MENFEITSGPLPGSEKIYVTGSRSDIRVPMRKIKLSPTVDLDGSKIENEDVVVYDTSGPPTKMQTWGMTWRISVMMRQVISIFQI